MLQVYNIGSLHSPGIGTTLFFEARGYQLSSVALICNNINMSTLKTLGANCPGLSQLWCRYEMENKLRWFVLGALKFCICVT